VRTHEIVREALGAIRATRMRSLLTALGVVIGIAAVITMVALGSGAQAAVQRQLDALGTDLLSISSGRLYSQGVATTERVNVTSDDALALRNEATTLKAVVPILDGDLQVKHGGRNVNVEVAATTPEFVEVHRIVVAAGRFFTVAEDLARERVAVLGAEILEEMELELAPEEIIGRQATIDGIPFTIIGVLERKGDPPGGIDADESIYIPLRTGQYRIFGDDRLSQIVVQVENPAQLNAALVDIERVLRRAHRLRPDQPNDFRVRDRSTFLAAQAAANETLTWLLSGIAAVSLLVGGIGIMNIMLVSVTERTREIGVRKALGARRHQILLQFLTEALTLCLLGGLVGIVVGIVAATSLSRLNGWPTTIPPSAIVLAVGFSVAVGLFFGVWPARRAAALVPVEALRYE
jgi:putative ABC transport system permease protein